MPQLRLQQGWSVDVGAPWSSEAESLGPRRAREKLKPGPGASASDVAEHQLDRIHDAMLELVAERGYGAVTARDLARRAGVSTRSFYQHYSGKEECFLAVYDQVADRILRALRAANQESSGDGQRKTARAVDAISREMDRDPRATRLLLIDAYDVGVAAIDRIRGANRSVEPKVGESDASTIVAQGILAGLASVAQGKLLDGRDLCMQGMADRLVRWALAYLGGSMAELDELSQISEHQVQVHSGKAASPSRGATSPVSGGDRALLISAAEKLIKAVNQEEITEKRLRTMAGVPRRIFKANFSSLEDCLALVLRRRIEVSFTRAKKASEKGLSPVGEVYRGVVTLCSEVVQDPVLRSLCLEDKRLRAALRLRGHQEFKTLISCLVAESIGISFDVDEVNIDASVGAFWGVAQRKARQDDPKSLPRMAVPLTYLILAPIIGPEQTIAAMRSELNPCSVKNA